MHWVHGFRSFGLILVNLVNFLLKFVVKSGFQLLWSRIEMNFMKPSTPNGMLYETALGQLYTVCPGSSDPPEKIYDIFASENEVYTIY